MPGRHAAPTRTRRAAHTATAALSRAFGAITSTIVADPKPTADPTGRPAERAAEQFDVEG